MGKGRIQTDNLSEITTKTCSAQIEHIVLVNLYDLYALVVGERSEWLS